MRPMWPRALLAFLLLFALAVMLHGDTLEQVDRRFNPFKNPIHKLVGCGKHRGHPVLGTQGAYDVTYWRLRNAVARDRRGEN